MKNLKLKLKIWLSDRKMRKIQTKLDKNILYLAVSELFEDIENRLDDKVAKGQKHLSVQQLCDIIQTNQNLDSDKKVAVVGILQGSDLLDIYK